MLDGDKLPDDVVHVALTTHVALVRVEGRGSFKISASLKQFGDAVVLKKLGLLLVDMAPCIGMDSTFMGVLAGVAGRMKTYAGQIVLIHCSARTRGLVATLGLDQLITAFETAETPSEYAAMFQGRAPREKLAPSAGPQDVETMRTMLEAHQHLVELVPENMPQFKDVLTFLRDEVARKTNETPKA